MKYCSNCGKQLDDSIKFCTACGQPVSYKKTSPKAGRLLPVILAVLALAVITGMFFLGRRSGKAAPSVPADSGSSVTAAAAETPAPVPSAPAETEEPAEEIAVFNKVMPGSYKKRLNTGSINPIGSIDGTYCIAALLNDDDRIEFLLFEDSFENESMLEVREWENISDFLIINDNPVALNDSGDVLFIKKTIETNGIKPEEWKDVVSIHELYDTIVALHADGTVEAKTLQKLHYDEDEYTEPDPLHLPGKLDLLTSLNGVESIATYKSIYAAKLSSGEIVSNYDEIAKAANSMDSSNGFYVYQTYDFEAFFAIGAGGRLSSAVIPNMWYSSSNFSKYEQEFNSMSHVSEIIPMGVECSGVYVVFDDGSVEVMYSVFGGYSDPEDSYYDQEEEYYKSPASLISNVSALSPSTYAVECLFISDGDVYRYSYSYSSGEKDVECVYKSSSESSKAVDCSIYNPGYILLADGSFVEIG